MPSLAALPSLAPLLGEAAGGEEPAVDRAVEAADAGDEDEDAATDEDASDEDGAAEAGSVDS